MARCARCGVDGDAVFVLMKGQVVSARLCEACGRAVLSDIATRAADNQARRERKIAAALQEAKGDA